PLALQPVIDLHVHVLPGIDDGPPTVADSLALARAASEGGTRTLVATPHLDHYWMVEPEQIPVAVAALTAELERAGVAIELRAGAEIAFSRLGDLDGEQLRTVRLGGGPYL